MTQALAEATVPSRPRRRLRLLSIFKGNRVAIVGLFMTVGIIAMALLAPWIAPADPNAINLPERLQPPSSRHLFGTDEVGRDLLSRIIWGSRISLVVGVGAVAISATVGTALGLVSGFFGGRVDALITGVLEIMLSFPLLLLALAIVALLGQSLTNIILAVGISGIPQFGRLVRGSVLGVRELEFVEAARALGASQLRTILQHVLPNVLAPLIVMITIRTATAIVVEASLSFLGLGDPTAVTWGQIVAGGRPYLVGSPWVSTLGGLAITVTVLGFNLLGDGLRDALDPRIGGKGNGMRQS